jgi:hypothetical protein
LEDEPRKFFVEHKGKSHAGTPLKNTQSFVYLYLTMSEKRTAFIAGYFRWLKKSVKISACQKGA